MGLLIVPLGLAKLIATWLALQTVFVVIPAMIILNIF